MIRVGKDPSKPDSRVAARVKNNLPPRSSRRFAIVSHPEIPDAPRIDQRGDPEEGEQASSMRPSGARDLANSAKLAWLAGGRPRVKTRGSPSHAR